MRHRALLVSVMAILMLAACTGGNTDSGGGTSQAPGESGAAGEGTAVDEDAVSGEVRFSGFRSSDAEEELLQETLDAFAEKYPNIDVTYEPIPEGYTDQMLAQFSAGDPPDLFYVQAEFAGTWMEQELLEPLDPYIEGNPEIGVEHFYPNLLAAFEYEGGTYGFPKDASPLALFYNPDLLEAAGVEPPTSWDELTAAAEALTTGDVTGVCLSPDLARVGAFVYENGGSIYNEDKTELTLGSPESVEAVDYYLGLLENDTAKTPAELGSGWCGEAFGKGQVAIAFEGNWMVSALDNDFPDTAYEIAEMPEATQQGNLAFTVAYSIGADSKNKEAAWVLLQYLAGQEGMAKWTSLGLALPARDDVEPAANREALVAGLEYATAYSFTPDFGDVQAAFNNKMTEVIESGGTGQEIVDAAVAAE